MEGGDPRCRYHHVRALEQQVADLTSITATCVRVATTTANDVSLLREKTSRQEDLLKNVRQQLRRLSKVKKFHWDWRGEIMQTRLRIFLDPNFGYFKGVWGPGTNKNAKHIYFSRFLDL